MDDMFIPHNFCLPADPVPPHDPRDVRVVERGLYEMIDWGGQTPANTRCSLSISSAKAKKLSDNTSSSRRRRALLTSR